MEKERSAVSHQATALKEKLQPLVEKYVNILLADLAKKGLVEELSDSVGGRIFKLRNKTGSNVILNSENTHARLATEDILDFRDLAQSLYFNLNEKLGPDREKIPVSQIVEEFQKAGVVNIPNLGSTRLRDILDKGKLLLNDTNSDIQKEGSELLDIQNNYNYYVGALLEYYVKEIAQKEFQGFKFVEHHRIGSTEIDLLAQSDIKHEPDAIFEIKYRRRALGTLREDLISSFEKMSRYDRTVQKDTCLIIIIFTDEGSDVLEKINYRFRQYMEESFPSFRDRIFLKALYSKNSHLLKEGLKNIHSQILNSNSTTFELELRSGAENRGIEGDDHLFEKVFDLRKFRYEISIEPQMGIRHWRVGLRFAQAASFPPRDKRHVMNYPLFHAEKNANSKGLKVSYYGLTGGQEYTKSTKILDYRGDAFTFFVSLSNNVARIDMVDKNRDSILPEPMLISGSPYFMLSAWADGKNQFHFKGQVKEQALKLSQGTIQLEPKANPKIISVEVLSENDHAIENCHIVLLAENNTFHEGYTSSDGRFHFQIPAETNYAILAAHPNYFCTILEKFDSSNDILVRLPDDEDGSGSIICPNGTGGIPGLVGGLNPILDTELRTYLYADNIAIDGGAQQPVPFEIDKPLFLEDKHANKKSVIFRFIRGKTSVVDFVSVS
ncbi:hypothetical protein [Chryseolinea lacunae]|uniref:Carboxypeptidase regulatory-like domain-containing protein n=1 Tax=Chryseolinea lacunae TaxID=2801331 RepID=A0ABS1KT32_9BACT|nr:hypothetical protein [Chryseolinea lacunae]MBL0742630.1 hypothetical protein [Chryseolinea lacunae]